ncbi:MAG: NfeD family protein [Chloroflexota bacterium]
MKRVLLRCVLLLLFVGGLTGLVLPAATCAQGSTIEVLQVDGTVVPVIADYIDRGITRAEENNATACIIQLNTPGGLLNSTEEIVGRIMNANVPVVVYVSPTGAWAASAGTFITLSAHIAAMTPGSTIGAAHPVSGGEQEVPEEQMKKITEFSAKWMRTIAEERGRNKEEAELAVTESKSFTDVDALENNLIDLRADNLDDLIAKIDGTEVKLANGELHTVQTDDGNVIRNEMNIFEKLLHVISDPNVAYILLTLATVGLVTEVASPGLIFPGVVGGISLLLAFYSLGVLNAHWGGIALMILAVGLLIAEYLTTSFGLFTAGGVAALVFGSLLLFSRSPGLELDRGLIAGVAIAIGLFSAFVLGAIVRGQRRRKTTGPEGMVGRPGKARTPLEPTGTVFADGELWTATAEGGRIGPGEEVTITGLDGMTLRVVRKSET